MDAKKKLVILTADAGFGHRVAAQAVERAVLERYGDAVAVTTVNLLDDPKTPRILRDSQSDYDKLVRRAPELYQIGYMASDDSITTAIGEGALAVGLYQAAAAMLREQQPDAIISTYPLYSAALNSAFDSKGYRVPLLLVITDLVTVHQIWYNRRVDYCMVPTESVAQQAMNAGIPAERIFLTGIPVNPQMSQRPADRNELRTSLGWQTAPKTFLAVGSKRVKQLLPVLNVLNHYGGEVQLAVVCGRDEELFRELSAVDWHIPVKLYQFVENMAPLLHAADAIICKAGGLITTEALACGLPMLIIEVIPGQEEGNASYVVEHEAGEFVKSPVEALEVIHHWLQQDGAELGMARGRAAAIGRPDAAYAIADLCWQALQIGPRKLENPARQVIDTLVSNVHQVREEIKSELALWDHEQFQLFLGELENNLKEIASHRRHHR